LPSQICSANTKPYYGSSLCIYFFFIETKGATLEEIYCTFNGEVAVEEMKVRALATEKSDMVERVEYLNKKGRNTSNVGQQEL
jgi:hypothetical protein